MNFGISSNSSWSNVKRWWSKSNLLIECDRYHLDKGRIVRIFSRRSYLWQRLPNEVFQWSTRPLESAAKDKQNRFVKKDQSKKGIPMSNYQYVWEIGRETHSTKQVYNSDHPAEHNSDRYHSKRREYSIVHLDTWCFEVEQLKDTVSLDLSAISASSSFDVPFTSFRQSIS